MGYLGAFESKDLVDFFLIYGDVRGDEIFLLGGDVDNNARLCVKQLISDLFEAQAILLKSNSIDGLLNQSVRDEANTNVRSDAGLGEVVDGSHL